MSGAGGAGGGGNGRLAEALARIDEANAKDPNTEVVGGEARPKELVYGERMSERLAAFAPEASEALQIAVRAQHIRRWEIPRSEYPMDKAGYHRWRTELSKRHAAHVAEILRGVGYDDAAVERVQSLVRKRNLKRDDEAQTLEDVVCLVFLQHYFADFAAKHEDDKVVDILKKTWAKMSDRGHEAALALPLGAREAALVKRALGT